MVQPQSVTQLALFDYATLDTETRIVVQQRTSEIKALMKRAASDIIDIGQKLIDVKARLEHGQYLGWLDSENIERTFAWRCCQVAVAFPDPHMLHGATFHARALYLLAAPSAPEEARTEAIARAEQGEPITYQAARQIVSNHRPVIASTDFETIRTSEFQEDVAAYIEDRTGTIVAVEDEENDVLDPPMEEAQAADLRRAARVNVGMFTSATPEWYTPSHIVERVEKVFGHIDLDPCSNSNDPSKANVPALHYWTQADDGIKQSWHGKVYMNPPYGDEISTWVARLLNAYENHEIHEAIALLPARTDTAWFQSLFDYPICFVRGRLKFSGAENSAPFPSAVIYFGPDTTLFDDFFHDIGCIK